MALANGGTFSVGAPGAFNIAIPIAANVATQLMLARR